MNKRVKIAAVTGSLAAGLLLWFNLQDEGSEVAAELVEPEVELPPKEQNPAFQRLQQAKDSALLPVGMDPAHRKRAWKQAVDETMATIEAEKRAQEELNFEVPERLRELDPRAAAQLERSNEIYQDWQEHHREKLEKLRAMEPIVNAASK